MSVKATERSMHVSLYMRDPLGRGCRMSGLCWHVLTGLRAPWSLLWGGEGRQKRLSGPLFGAGPVSGCADVPFGFGYSLLVFEHLGCWGRVLCTNRLRYYCVCSAHVPFSLAQKSASPQLRWEAGVGSQTPARNPAPELAPNAAVLNPRFVCPLDFLLCNCPM